MDSEPRLAEELKAIRDKKERFFERKEGQEVVAPVPESAAGTKKERPGRLRMSYECESQVAVRVTRLGISRPGICLWSQEALLRADYGHGHVNASGESVRSLVVRVPRRGCRPVRRGQWSPVRPWCPWRSTIARGCSCLTSIRPHTPVHGPKELCWVVPSSVHGIPRLPGSEGNGCAG